MTAWVLVLTGHPTLTVALTLQGEWEVAEDPDVVPDDARADAIVVLDDAQDGARSLPPWADPARAILLTTDAATATAWDGLVLQRPYRLDDLMASVRQLAAGRPEPDEAVAVVVETELVGALEGAAVPAAEPEEAVRAAPESDPPRLAPATPAIVLDPEVPEREDQQTDVSEGGDPFEREILAAIGATGTIRDVLDRAPALGSRRQLAEVLAREIADALDGLTVGIWQADADAVDRFDHLAGVGLTPGETMIPVRRGHPVVADALESGGTAVEHVADDPGRVSGLPASRHPTLLVAPCPLTPLGELLVIVGLPAALPEDAFEAVDQAVAALQVPMELVVALEELTATLSRA